MNRRVISIIVVAVLAVAAFLLFNSPSSNNVSAEREPIRSLFVENRISAGDFNRAINSFFLSLPDSDLTALEQSFHAISPDSPSAALFVGIMGDLIAFEREQNRIAQEFEPLQNLTFEEACPNIEAWETKAEEASNLIVTAIELKKRIDALYADNQDLANLGIFIDIEALTKEVEQIDYEETTLFDTCIIMVYSEFPVAEEGETLE